MALTIKDEDTIRLAEKLADRQGVNKIEAIRLALENELHRLDKTLPLREQLRPLQKRVLARAATGRNADKVFFDELCDDT